MNLATLLQNTATKYDKVLRLAPYLKLQELLRGAITVRSNVKNEQVISMLDTTAEMAPHSSNYSPQTGVNSIKGRLIKVYVGSLVFLENVEDLRNTFMDELIDNQSNKHPLEMQILTAVMGNVGQRLALNLFKAVRNSNGTTTADLFDGFDTIATAEKAANKISIANGNYKNLGTVTENDIIDAMIAFYDSWDDNLKSTPNVKVNISHQVLNAVRKNLRADDPYLFAQNTPFGQKLAEIIGWNTDVEVIPHFGKKNSPWIQATVPANMIAATDKESDLGAIKVREVDDPWKNQFAMKGCFGVEYATLDKRFICFGELNLNS